MKLIANVALVVIFVGALLMAVGFWPLVIGGLLLLIAEMAR